MGLVAAETIVDSRERPVDIGAGACIGSSIVILTYARDETLKATLAHLKQKLGERQDVEIVLVDNNPDTQDRSPLLAAFPTWQVVKSGANKGVSARNDGMEIARGAVIALLDDDVLVETADFLDRFQADFAANPDVGLIVARKLDAKTMTLLPECIPHTRKTIDATKMFLTFRFTGGLVGVRKAMFQDVGGFSPEFFFGQEEYDYSYRIIKKYWNILYDPDIVAIETNAAGGRSDERSVQTDVLRNRYMIAYLHMPFVAMVAHVLFFTAYLYVKKRGRMSVTRAVGNYVTWLAKPGRDKRQPMDRRTQNYIRACGGAVWR